MLNVIAGTAGGLRLKTIDSDKTKPTLGRVKEALFSMISDYIPGACVLDLFTGSGSLGIEALSRGAEYCYFNDSNKECCKITRDNLNFTGLISRGTVSQYEFKQALDIYGKEKKRFDIVFLDPPYGMDYYNEAICALKMRKLINSNGIVVAEHSIDKSFDDIDGFEIIKRKKYGSVGLTVFAIK